MQMLLYYRCTARDAAKVHRKCQYTWTSADLSVGGRCAAADDPGRQKRSDPTQLGPGLILDPACDPIRTLAVTARTATVAFRPKEHQRRLKFVSERDESIARC